MKRILHVVLVIPLVCVAMLADPGCGGDKSVRYYNQGLDAANRDDLDTAIRLWNEALRYRPDDAETRYNLGMALISKKRYAEAEVQLREAIRLSPQDYQAYQLLGESLEAQDSTVEAKRSYEFSLSLRPNYVPALIGLASVALAENQNKTAEDYAARAVETEPSNVEANLLLSEAYYRNSNFSAAYGQLLAARKMAPSNPEMLVLLGKVEYARHMYPDAIGTLESARNLGVATDELFLYLGLSCLAIDRLTDAEKYFRLAVFKSDRNESAWKGLGETFLKQKKWRDAADAITRALAINPDDAEAMLDHALIAMYTGDFATAARELETVKRRPDAPQITPYYLGHAYMRSGKKTEARIAFQEFVNTWQGDRTLLNEAQSILATLAP
jgi:Flp pilus assembly protein TadD